jgi:hypothetical protein
LRERAKAPFKQSFRAGRALAMARGIFAGLRAIAETGMRREPGFPAHGKIMLCRDAIITSSQSRQIRITHWKVLGIRPRPHGNQIASSFQLHKCNISSRGVTGDSLGLQTSLWHYVKSIS